MFLFSSIFKNKKYKKLDQKNKTNKNYLKKKNHPDKKNGNDFGDEIKECLFVIFASYFTGETPWGSRIDNTLTNITEKKRKKRF